MTSPIPIIIVPSGLNAWEIATEHEDGTLRPLLLVTRVDQAEMTEEIAEFIVDHMATGLAEALQMADGPEAVAYLQSIQAPED